MANLLGVAAGTAAGTGAPSPGIQIGSRDDAGLVWVGTGTLPLTTTLTAGINNSVTSIAVSGFTNFPGSGQYVILIDTEQMLVTAGQGTTTWTVTRGYNGSIQAAHSSGASVWLIGTLATITLGANYTSDVTGRSPQAAAPYDIMVPKFQVTFIGAMLATAQPKVASITTNTIVIATNGPLASNLGANSTTGLGVSWRFDG